MRRAFRRHWLLALALLVGCGQPQAPAAVPAAAPPPSPPNKLTQIANNEATYAALSAGRPTATIDPTFLPPANCPKDTQTRIEPVTYSGLKGGPNTPLASLGANVVNRAIFYPPGTAYDYEVIAGALYNDKTQGAWIISRARHDRCTDKLGVDFYTHYPLTPQKRGKATIVAIDGAGVLFTYAQGGAGRLDVETEQFTEVPVAALPTPGTPARATAAPSNSMPTRTPLPIPARP